MSETMMSVLILILCEPIMPSIVADSKDLSETTGLSGDSW